MHESHGFMQVGEYQGAYKVSAVKACASCILSFDPQAASTLTPASYRLPEAYFPSMVQQEFATLRLLRYYS